MAITVKKIDLWRRDVENSPGMLAETLGPLAEAGADLTVVMGYRFPGQESQAAIEVYPVSGRKMQQAARSAGLRPSGIPTLLLEGENRPALGHALAQALADAGINLAFLVAQVIGRRYLAVIGFESEADARRAGAIIKKAAAGRRR
jgi:hypothetical protein